MLLPTRTDLIGKYKTPRFRIGDIVQCAIRGEVRIVGISDGLIPWPIAQRPGERARGFVIYEGLEAALRREAGVAICHWWGVYKMTVSRWKRLLGIGPNTEGSGRLRREYGLDPDAMAVRKAGLEASANPGMRDRKHSKETKQRMRDAHLGKPLSDEHRRKIGLAHRGLKRSAAARKRISEGIRKSKTK